MRLKRVSAICIAMLMLVSLFMIVGCNQGPASELQPPPPAPNREEQRQAWDFPRPSDVNEVMDHYPIPLHTLQAVGSDFVTENTRVAPLGDDQINITIMNENTIDTMRIGNETTPHGMYEAMRVWEATHGGTVAVRVTPLDQQDMVLRTSVAASEPPDIIQLYKGGFPRWPAQQLLQSMLTFEGHLNLYYNTLWDEHAMEHYRWNGHYFGMVARGNAIGFRSFTIFNQTLFDNAGVMNPFEHYLAGNWNWTQFVETANQMATFLGGEGYGFTSWGLFPDRGPYPVLRIIECRYCECCGRYEREPITDDELNGFWPTIIELAIDDPNYINWLTAIHDFYQTPAPALGWNLQQWRADMPRNLAAMSIGALDMMGSMVHTQQTRNTGSNLRIAPMHLFDPTGQTDPVPVTYMLAHAIPHARVLILARQSLFA